MLDTCKKIDLIDKVFIIHYEPLTDRKKYIDSIINSLGIPYEFIINNEKTDSLINENIVEYYTFNENILPRRLGLGELSVSISHLNVYKRILKENLNYSLILEDDAILCENFIDYINLLFEEVDDYDFIFLSSCCNLNTTKNTNKFLYESNLSRCATGYIVSNKKLKEVLEISPTISTPIDAHLNHIKPLINLKFAWSEPTIITQGSEGVYQSNLR